MVEREGELEKMMDEVSTSTGGNRTLLPIGWLAGEWDVGYFSPRLLLDTCSLYTDKDTLLKVTQCLLINRI